jgi:hypothetical protein
MANKLDQDIPNRVPRKLGAQLGVVLAIMIPVAAMVFIGGINAWIYRKEYGPFLLFILVLLVGPLRLFIAQQGYQIGYDDERLYMRNWGWHWFKFRRFPVHSMRYDEIDDIESRYLERAAVKRSFYPFDYIAISSRNADVPDIEIYPIYLRPPHDKRLIEQIYKERPELLPEEVVDYMNSDRPL